MTKTGDFLQQIYNNFGNKFPKKWPKYLVALGIFIKTAAASFVKFGLLFIPTSGHTENKRKNGLE